jgi:hypothetical protein
VGRHTATQDPLHVLYLGSSADLGALRRLMEAHGAVTRSRLTPALTVVIVDSSVPRDHPTLRSAATLGIPVMDPAEALAHFADWYGGTGTGVLAPARPATPVRRSWRFRRPTR